MNRTPPLGIIVTTQPTGQSDIAVIYAEQLVNRWTRSGGRIVDVREGIGDVDEPEVVVAMLALF